MAVHAGTVIVFPFVRIVFSKLRIYCGMPVGFYCVSDSVLGIREHDWVVVTWFIEARTVKLPWNIGKRMLPILKDQFG